MNNCKMIIVTLFTVIIICTDSWSDEWLQKTGGATPRRLHSAVVSDDKIYIFGGTDSTNPDQSEYFRDLWEYDIINDSWSQKVDGPAPRDCHSAVAYSGKIYVFGGFYKDIYHSNLWEYNIADDIWSVKSTQPPGRNNHMAVLYDKKMYIFGGGIRIDDKKYNFNDLWEYHILKDKWTQKSNSPFSLESGTAVVYKNAMFVFGGSLDGETFSNRVLKYDFLTDEWSLNNIAPFSSAAHSAIVYDDKMYIFGGARSDTDQNLYLSNNIIEYDFIKNSWSGMLLGDIPSRAGHISVVHSGKMYVFGGESGVFTNGVNRVNYNDLWVYKIENEPYDISGDGKTGLVESIHILKSVSGIAGAGVIH